MSDKYIYIWLSIFIIMAILEFVSFNLITIWFSISAMIVTFLSFFITSFKIQVLLFTLMSFLLLIFAKKIVEKYFLKTKFNSDSVGTKVKIVSKDENYSVRFKGSLWTAISNGNIEYEIGEYVEIERFEGNKIIIK